ncbi:hypothetical protein B0H14DRAFT_2585859 [Mycena olivaceomarginata]|nr:hypothetical protein B0H14DRAFT_2585859 [Mycena olivaceomarginata]
MALYLKKPLSRVPISTDVQADHEALIHAHSNVEEILPDQTVDVSVDTQNLVAGATDAHATMIADVSADMKTLALVTEATDDEDVMMTIGEIRAAWKLKEETKRLLSPESGTPRRKFVVKRRQAPRSSYLSLILGSLENMTIIDQCGLCVQTMKHFDFASAFEPSMATSSATASDSLDLTRNRNENVYSSEKICASARTILQTSLTVTRGLGKLKYTRIAQLATPIETFLEQYQTARPQLTKVQDLLEPLVQQVPLGLEHILILPSTFNQMVVSVTALQRTFLEAKALVRYMTEFKPRMVDLGSKSPPPAEHCVGVFTINPAIAQQFSAAGLPYWLLRPTWTFTTENILEVVAPWLPANYLMLDPAPDATHFSTKPDTDSKYAVIHKLSSKVPWYKDPFVCKTVSSVIPAVAYPPNNYDLSLVPPHKQPQLPVWKTASSVIPAAAYPPNNYDLTLTPQLLLVAPRPPIVGVAALLAAALAAALPALVVSLDNVAHRQLFLQNLSLMMDALIYRLGDPDTPHDLLSGQQWALRMVMRQGGGGQTQASARSIGLHELLAPVFRACGLENEDFTAMPGTAQPITVHRAQEMLWMVAETNVCFELLALDHPIIAEAQASESREWSQEEMLELEDAVATLHASILRVVWVRRSDTLTPRPRIRYLASYLDA